MLRRSCACQNASRIRTCARITSCPLPNSGPFAVFGPKQLGGMQLRHATSETPKDRGTRQRLLGTMPELRGSVYWHDGRVEPAALGLLFATRNVDVRHARIRPMQARFHCSLLRSAAVGCAPDREARTQPSNSPKLTALVGVDPGCRPVGRPAPALSDRSAAATAQVGRARSPCGTQRSPRPLKACEATDPDTHCICQR